MSFFQQPFSPLVLLAIQALAFWPVWRWYLARLTDASDEPWGVLALLTAVIFLAWHKKAEPVEFLKPLPLVVCCVLVLIYAVTFPVLPPLLRAILAVLALSCTLSMCYLGRSVHIGILGLLLLSLPLIASLQFYLGYPVRVLTAEIASRLIAVTGYPVVAAGNCFHWAGEVIAVDAPCSGIKMLWSGLYVNFTLACFGGLSPSRTWLSYSLSTLTIFIGNLIRTTILFYAEAGIIRFPRFPQFPTDGHQVIGLVAFVCVVLVIMRLHVRLQRPQQISMEAACA